MIKTVEGKLVFKEPTLAIVKVGGIGLGLHLPLSTYSALPEIESQVHFFAYLYVREDQLKLFGFATEPERELFLLLLGVNKVGPNVALQVLSSCSVDSFKQLVANEDTDALASMVKGVGKKTAELMILELKDKIEDFVYDSEGAKQCASLSPDAVKALVELGSSPSAARKEVEKAVKQTGKDASADVILRQVFDNR